VKQLKETNAYLGDQAALDRILKEQGYWYFRDVLDHEVLLDLQKKFRAILTKWDVSDPDLLEPMWNGNSLEGIANGLAQSNSKVPELREERVWQDFVAHPKIAGFIESLIGGPLEWLEVADFYRLVPPTIEVPEDPYIGRHQDGVGLIGLDCVICWIPLHSIDEKVGGLAVAVDTYSGELFPDRFFDPELVTPDVWARADYRLGDILMMDPSMLHAGLPNLSDKFRLSLDLRVLRPSSPRPIEGTVLAIDKQEVTIKDQKGETATYRIDEHSHLRGLTSKSDVAILISADELTDYIPAGSKIWATSQADRIAILRPNGH